MYWIKIFLPGFSQVWILPEFGPPYLTVGEVHQEDALIAGKVPHNHFLLSVISIDCLSIGFASPNKKRMLACQSLWMGVGRRRRSTSTFSRLLVIPDVFHSSAIVLFSILQKQMIALNADQFFPKNRRNLLAPWTLLWINVINRCSCFCVSVFFSTVYKAVPILDRTVTETTRVFGHTWSLFRSDTVVVVSV